MSFEEGVVDPATAQRGYGQVSYGNDAALLVQFETQAIEGKDSAGKIDYINQDYIIVTKPGGDSIKHEVPQKFEEDAHYVRKHPDFPSRYQTWKASNKIEEIEGTPLKMWPAIDPAMVMSLGALSILSVEQLAALSDIDLQKVGPKGRELRTKAQTYLANAESSDEAIRLAKDLESEKKVNKRLRSEVKELKKLLDKINANG
jgi:hypothetical protein